MHRREYFQTLIQGKYSNEWHDLPLKLQREIQMLAYNFSDPRLITNPFTSAATIADKLGITIRTIQRHHLLIRKSKDFADNPENKELQELFGGYDKKWVNAYKWLQIIPTKNKTKANMYILYPILHENYNNKYKPTDNGSQRCDKIPIIPYKSDLWYDKKQSLKGKRYDKNEPILSSRYDKIATNAPPKPSATIAISALSLEDLSLYDLNPTGAVGSERKMSIKELYNKRIRDIIYNYPNKVVIEAYHSITEHPKSLDNIDLTKQEFKRYLQDAVKFFVSNNYTHRKIYMFQLKTLLDTEVSIEKMYVFRLEKVVQKSIRWDVLEKYDTRIDKAMEKHPDNELKQAIQHENQLGIDFIVQNREENKKSVSITVKSELDLLKDFREDNQEMFTQFKSLVLNEMVLESRRYWRDEPEMMFKPEMINASGMTNKLHTLRFRSFMADRIREFNNA